MKKNIAILKKELLEELIKIVIIVIAIKIFITYGLPIFGIQDITVIGSESMIHGDIWKIKFKTIFNNTLPHYFPFEDGLYPGDIVVVMKVKNPCIDIQKYDVIQFEVSKGTRIVHRVIKKIYLNNNTCYFVTQGDNNVGSLPWEVKIDKNKVRGKVILRIPGLGYPRYLIYKILGI